MQEAALVTVDLVREAALQSLARVVESLLRVAYAVQQLARERAGATVDAPLEIVNIGHNQFRCRARCGRAEIRGDRCTRRRTPRALQFGSIAEEVGRIPKASLGIALELRIANPRSGVRVTPGAHIKRHFHR